MRKFIMIIILALAGNLIILTIGYGQNNVNVSGYVPETEANRNIKANKEPLIGTTKENKYQYFFEKYWLGIENEKSADNEKTHTMYDRISSHALMVLIILLAAITTFFLIKLVDFLVVHHFFYVFKKH